MSRDEVYKLIEANGLTLHGDIEHFAALVSDHIYAEYLEQPEPKQSGTISITAPAPIAYLCENAVGHKYFRWKKPSSTYKPIALYTHLPAQQALDKMAENARELGLGYEPAQQEPVSLEDSLKESKVCCGDYAKCHRACTPRGRWEALRLVETAQPAQRTWVGLTDEELREFDVDPIEAKLMIAKLKEKNNG